MLYRKDVIYLDYAYYTMLYDIVNSYFTYNISIKFLIYMLYINIYVLYNNII